MGSQGPFSVCPLLSLYVPCLSQMGLEIVLKNAELIVA